MEVELKDAQAARVEESSSHSQPYNQHAAPYCINMTGQNDEESQSLDCFDKSEDIEPREHRFEPGSAFVARLFNRVNQLDMRKIFIVFLFSYVLLCVFFAVVMLFLSYIEPTCISPYDATEDKISFHDAFILSWYVRVGGLIPGFKHENSAVFVSAYSHQYGMFTYVTPLQDNIFYRGLW